MAPQTDTPPCATGTVLAQRVVEYLQAVTGQSGEEGQLRALHHMLDPEAAGAALDLPTFHAVMKEWIASCQQEGSVAGDQGQNAVPCVPAGATDSSHLPRGSWLAEERDAAAGDLGLVLAGGCRCRKGPKGGSGESVAGGAGLLEPWWGRRIRLAPASAVASPSTPTGRLGRSCSETSSCRLLPSCRGEQPG